jgi:hypothetical protein
MESGRRSMQRLARLRSASQLAAAALLVSLWLGLTVLLLASRGQPEAFLIKKFGRFSRDDAFEHLNGIAVIAWPVFSILVLIAMATTRYRRPVALAVLMIGPVIAASIVLIDQRWADPNWFEIVAVCSIGSLVGSIVVIVYWLLRRQGPRIRDGTPPATST